MNGYKLWCIKATNHKCIVSRDVIFNDSKIGYNQTENPNEVDGCIAEHTFSVEVEHDQEENNEH